MAADLQAVANEKAVRGSGAIMSDMDKYVRRLGGYDGDAKIQRLGKDMIDMGLVKPFGTASNTADLAMDLIEKTGPQIGQIFERADAIGNAAQKAKYLKASLSKWYNGLDAQSQNVIGNKFNELYQTIDSNVASGGGYQALNRSGQVFGKDAWNTTSTSAAKELGKNLDSVYGDAVENLAIKESANEAARKAIDDALAGQQFANGGLKKIAQNRLSQSPQIKQIGQNAFDAERDLLDENLRKYHVAKTASEFSGKMRSRQMGNQAPVYEKMAEHAASLNAAVSGKGGFEQGISGWLSGAATKLLRERGPQTQAVTYDRLAKFLRTSPRLDAIQSKLAPYGKFAPELFEAASRSDADLATAAFLATEKGGANTEWDVED
jgi:hypothetical protein